VIGEEFVDPRPDGGTLVTRPGFPTFMRAANRSCWQRLPPSDDGRHSFASLLLHEGRSLGYVTAELGHSTAATTLRHYSHVYAEAQLATAENMAEAILSARRDVRKTCATSEPRRLRQAAPLA
jgi:integrase